MQVTRIIGVANKIAATGVRDRIYADDIALWISRGSDVHIKDNLQEAVNAIENHLEKTGLTSSPSKSALLVLPP